MLKLEHWICWGALATGVLAQPAWSKATTAGHWTVESVEGAGSVQVLRKGKSYQGPEGSVLQPGDTVKTGPSVSTRVVDTAGNEVVIGRNSSFQVRPLQQGTQVGQLDAGYLRAKVQKASQGSKSKIKFAIKTKSSILGVRGTEFTVDVPKEGEAVVHTLEGRVDAAKDEKSLFAGKGIPVAAGEMIQTALGAPLPAPIKFNREEFLANLKGVQPEAGQLLQKAVRPPLELQKIQRPNLPPMPAGAIPPVSLPKAPLPTAPLPAAGPAAQPLPGVGPGGLPNKPPGPPQMPPPQAPPPPKPPSLGGIAP